MLHDFLSYQNPLLHRLHPLCMSPDAVDRMDTMLSSPTAWQSQYRDVSSLTAPGGPTDNTLDMGDLRVPECAEAFVTLMTTILGR